MLFDNFTLFAANGIMLAMMAAAFLAAANGRQNEPYWRSWFWANVALTAGILGYMSEPVLPDVMIVVMPNALLVLGFSLRWRAARQFNGRQVPALQTWGPSALFVAVCAVPQVYAHYWMVFLVVNVGLTWLALSTGFEFWRERADARWSRLGLVTSYTLMGLSFAARIAQGAFQGSAMMRALPDDLMLNIHLVVAMVYTAGSGAFALSVAYERGAAQLKATAMRDALTGLYNRRAFEDYMHMLLDADAPRPFAVGLFDLDHFKQINDRHGHAAGDAALQTFARAALGVLREGDMLARIGGEEFAVILPGASTEAATQVVERVREAVKGTEIARGGQTFGITLSAGVCASGNHEGGYDALMRRADRLLYEAKRQGRDRVVIAAA